MARGLLLNFFPITILHIYPLESQSLPSINQLAIEVKLIEAWKAKHVDNYPTKMYPAKDQSNTNSSRTLRESSIRELKDFAKTRAGQNSFCITTGKIWNNSPNEIKNAKNIITAKRLIKAYCKSMPI